ncbi:hypothetical protein Nepgr_021115 [Nepenthes gracilis]|uniref:Uncharacterized protein n=1 Tax=Nepenthes gracilis TaxID=150966 RepID=A0AAD3XWR6_NEPGR|nr:hypothetical protein Nepgr_021115 [Nepenthes gracilis]
MNFRQADEQMHSFQSFAFCPDHVAGSMGMVVDDKETIIRLNNFFVVLQDPVAPDVQEDSANERKANKGIRESIDLRDPLSVQMMNLAVRADEESCVDRVESSLSRIGNDSIPNQPPSLDAVISKPVMDDACFSSNAEDRQHQYAVEKGIVEGKFGLNARGEHGLVSCPKIIPESLPHLEMQVPRYEDRLAALGTSSCLEEEVGSPALGSAPSPHVDPANQHGGEPWPCSTIGKLRRNIAVMRMQFEAARSQSDRSSPLHADALTPASDGGGSKSSHPRSKRRKKKCSPNPTI